MMNDKMNLESEKELLDRIMALVKDVEPETALVLLAIAQQRLMRDVICKDVNNTLRKLRYIDDAQKQQRKIEIKEGKSPIQELIDKIEEK